MKIVLPALAVSTLLSFPIPARAQLTLCDDESSAVRRGGWLLDVSYRQSQSAPQSNNLKQLHLAVHNYPGAQATRGAGTAGITDGTSNTIFVGEGPVRVSCADVDGDSVAGIASIELELRNPVSEETIVVRVAPLDGELDEDGDEPVRITIGATTVIGRAFQILSAGPDRPEA
jgi:hypothetical protein